MAADTEAVGSSVERQVCARIAFAIPLKPKRASADWEQAQVNLRRTLRSIESAGASEDVVVAVACHEEPELAGHKATVEHVLTHGRGSYVVDDGYFFDVSSGLLWREREGFHRSCGSVAGTSRVAAAVACAGSARVWARVRARGSHAR